MVASGGPCGAGTMAGAMRTLGALWTISMTVCVTSSCGGGAPDARYPAHEAGCPVKSFPAAPAVPVDDLGLVTVDCGSRRGGCEREAFDVVCARGGDVAWGLADNELTSTKLVLHAAHTRRALESSREPGCPVRAFVDAPPMPTENIGLVVAHCAPEDSQEVCLRELEDRVCALGGDVVWQVEGPAPEATSNGNKQRMRGRAAHSK
jgi:hypothetical protein